MSGGRDDKSGREAPFTKMHGAGNDYVYFDVTGGEPGFSAEEIQRISDRRTGVGGDGVVLIARPMRSDAAHVRMQMHNADGSEGAMCGNAIRCVAKYALERGLTTANPLVVETASGDKTLHCELVDGLVRSVRVDMGPPILRPSDVPARIAEERAVDFDFAALEPELAAGRALRGTAVSMGNPHLVFFVDEPTDELVLGLGPKIETCALFPKRVNVEFVRVDSPTELTMRVWERGSGETHACGTGACAAAVAAILTGRTERDVTIHLRGGDLRVEWPADDASVYMTGPAAYSFDGVWRG